jgi:protocatechuate 3,4-dioxygenase beta subunit
MRASTWVGVLVLLVGAGVAAWLLLQTQGDRSDDLLELDPASEAARHEGPVLTGQARTRNDPEPLTAGRFEIPVKVVDAKGAPLVGVRVVARRQGEAWEPEDTRRWFGIGARDLARVMQAGPGCTEPWPLGGEATSGEGGLAKIVVTRRAEYLLRAEPDAPRVGTSSTWMLNSKPPTEPALLRVLDGSPLNGRVIDGSGRGVEVAVSATSRGSEHAWGSDPICTHPTSGAFRFPGVPAGKVDLRVLIPGRMSFLAPTLTTPHADEVIIRIPDGAPLLSGVVRGADGVPVAGAHVAATVRLATADDATPQAQASGAATYYATSDAEGAFQVVGPFGGALTQLQAMATGYVPHASSPPLATWSGLELAPGREARVEIVLFQGGVIEGRVLEAGTGAPLAGATVEAHPAAVDGRMPRPAYASAVSDAQGRYRLSGVVVGRSLLLVRHPSHFVPAQEALRTTNNRGFVWDGDAQAASIPPDLLVFVEREGQHVTRDVTLTPGIPVRGKVVDGQGNPVVGAEVRAAGYELGQMAWQWGVQVSNSPRALATSGPDGRFEIAGLAPREDWLLYAVKPPLVDEPGEPLALRAGVPPSEVVLRLVTGCVVAGRVIDGDGKPVEGVQIWVQSQDQRTGSAMTARTAVDGTFRVEGVPAAALWVSAHNSRSGSHVNQQIERLKPGEVREGIELTLASGSSAVTGVLVDEQGKPAARVRMTATSARGTTSQTMTSDEGHFRFEGLQAGQVTLFAGIGNDNVQLEQVTAPAQDLRLTWKRVSSAVIEGVVVDPQGNPVPICRVNVRAASKGRASRFPEGLAMPMMGNAQGEIAVNGWFRRQVQGEGPYQVVVSMPQDGVGRPLNLRSRVHDVASAAESPVTVRLEPGLEVAGRVVDHQGRGVAGVRVATQNIGTTTDAEGRFSIGGLGEGDAAIQARPKAPFVTPAPVPASPGDRDVVVRLVTGLPIAGTLVYANGDPVKNAWVQASWQGPGGSGNLSDQPDAEGRFRVEGVPPDVVARVMVQTWGQDGSSAAPPRTIEGVRPGTEDLRIEIGRGVAVSGTALDSDGKPVKEAWVQISVADKPGSEVYAEVKPDGRFEAIGIEPGATVNLILYLQSGGTVGETVTVQAPASGIKLVRPPTMTLRGQLRGSLGRSKWRVWAWTEGEPRRHAHAKEVDGQGRFSLENVTHKGPWRIAASAPDDDRYGLSDPVDAGGRDAMVDLRTGRSIEGVVLAPDGTPAKGAHVSVQNQAFGTGVACDERGEFRVRGLPPGSYGLVAMRPEGGQAQLRDVADGTTGLRLQITASGDAEDR